MKFFKENDKTPFLVVAFGIVLYLGLSNIQLMIKVISYVSSVAFPFILGSCLAFIINVPMSFFERKVFSTVKKGKRALSIVSAIACIIGVILFVLGLIIPELVDTLYKLSNSIPGFARQIQDVLNQMTKNNPAIHKYIEQMEIDWNKVSGELMNYLQTWATGLLNSTVSVISGAVQAVISFALGLVFALNALLKKEILANQIKKLLFAILPVRIVENMIKVGRLSVQTFSNFLSGQCMEAVILGMLIFISMQLFGIPYAILIAVFIGVTSLIPIVGGFIGCWVGVFLILMVDWKQAIIFIVVFVVIQEIEGNLIYPHVVGNSVGLPAIWVLVAVTVGGNISGVVGMIFSIPICSVLYQLLAQFVNKQIRKRGLENIIKNV